MKTKTSILSIILIAAVFTLPAFRHLLDFGDAPERDPLVLTWVSGGYFLPILMSNLSYADTLSMKCGIDTSYPLSKSYCVYL